MLPLIDAWAPIPIAPPIFRRGRILKNSGNDASPCITVLGGTGFVGSRVCKTLVKSGASVTSVSTGGRVPDWCAGDPWTEKVKWVSQDLTRGAREKMEAAIGTPDCLVSCIGTVGVDVQGLLLGNGITNKNAAAAAKKAGTSRFVFCSVASEVVACKDGWLPAYFGGYFRGKFEAEQAFQDAAKANGGTTCIIRPTFIYGGDSFGLIPPRVSFWYGSIVEEILSLGLVQKVADILPGLLKVALRPPVSVDAVADACAASALGSIDGTDLDGTFAINTATGQPTATGFSDLTAAVMAKFRTLTDDGS